jgi:hypothetical protein
LATHFKSFFVNRSSLLVSGTVLTVLLVAPGLSHTASIQQLVEDFSTFRYSDQAASTGVWNTTDQVAQAAVVANSDTSRKLNFGDGSDGVLSSSDGYTFDTDTHPKGYNFDSVSITGGTIIIKGSYPLVIRSRTSVTFSPELTLNGTVGSNGVLQGSVTEPTGGSSSTCIGKGGNGGSANASTGTAGGDGVQASGITEAATGGAGKTGAGSADDAANSVTGPGASSTFETSSSLICGTGGGGGGGHSVGGAFGTGGAGGGGGGVVHIVALGNITLGQLTANGGDGGTGASGGAVCAGNGAGGNGGAIWLQTFHTASTTSLSVAGGTGSTNGCNLGGVSGVNGSFRVDAVSGISSGFSTANADINQSYAVQSKAYDLSTLNATFPSDPTITSESGNGTVSVSYAGSSDGATFSDFTDQIQTLNNKNYRYLKFKVTLLTASVAGLSPTVSKIVIPYSDLGLGHVDLKMTMGCGSMTTQRDHSNQNHERRESSDSNSPQTYFAVLLIFGFSLSILSLLRRHPDTSLS